MTVDKHGKMPDVVLYYPEKDWLLLVESVTSSGPVDGKRHWGLLPRRAGGSAPHGFRGSLAFGGVLGRLLF